MIRSKDEEIQSLQELNSELTADRSEKEHIILELQGLLEQTQNALRESQNHQDKKPWIPNMPSLAFMRGGGEHTHNNIESRDDPNSDFVSFGAYTSGKVPQDPDLWSRPLEENPIRKKQSKTLPSTDPRPSTEPLATILTHPPISPLILMSNEDPLLPTEPQSNTQPTDNAFGHINLDYSLHNGNSH
ncbi:hypothetical protein LOD99_16214 [Oopsacas minuta]|uniref:Uncharacterized protein n=1 Tax=Oopsacas minuta TaxID=111878 RepID=A0AAV7K6I4_9METZ|nr:hypothetical protein LOD99_16214 [Oopsacas minuta]